MQNSTIAAIATAPGAGGIAVVRLSGPESYAVAARVFRPANPAKKVEEAKGYTALFGSFLEGRMPLTRAWPCFSGHPTVTPAKMWWSCPAMAGALWPGGWWRAAWKPGLSRRPPASTPAARS